jgi:hypothetical protein
VGIIECGRRKAQRTTPVTVWSDTLPDWVSKRNGLPQCKKNIDILVFAYILLPIDALTAVGRSNKRGNTEFVNGLRPTKKLLEIDMKKVLAIVAVLASAQASAWWGNNGYNNQYNNGYGYGNGYSNGAFDGVGDAAGSGDFSMSFSGRGRTNMRGYGNGYGAGDGWGRGYNQSAPYWGAPYAYGPGAPVAPAPVAPAAPEAAE